MLLFLAKARISGLLLLTFAYYCMGINVTYDLKTAEGREAEALRSIIEMRKKELGETTAQACKAIAITVLKSLRADTPIAKTTPDILISYADSRYYPSWKKVGKKAKRILRAGKNGAEVKPDKVVWLTKKYVKGEEYHTFQIFDVVSKERTIKYFIVAPSEKVALKAAQKFHRSRVKQYRKLAKFALGLAMHGVSTAQGIDSSGVNNEARKVGLELTRTSVSETGFNSGEVNIHVEDNLNYAAKALKHGEGYVDVAMQKALNSITGYLKKRLERKGIKDALKTPFPEVAQ